MAVAIACVATALLLYVASTLVFDFSDEGDEGALVSMRRPAAGGVAE